MSAPTEPPTAPELMSEERALTSFAGNAVATVLVGNGVGEFDRAKAGRVPAGDEPFDEATMLDQEPDDNEPGPAEPTPVSDKPSAGTPV